MKMTSRNVVGALYHVALHQNRNAVLFDLLRCALLCRENKHHIHATSLRSSYTCFAL